MIAKENDPIWCAGYLFLNLTEKQVEALRVIMRSNLYCGDNRMSGDVELPNGIILKKMTMNYEIWCDGYYHHTVECWNDAEAIRYAKKKSALYGCNHQVTLYGSEGRMIGDYYCGFGHEYKSGKKGAK